MKWIFTILFLIAGLSLFSQEDSVIITLEYQWEKSRKYDFYISEIIDNRVNNNCIGYFPWGLKNKSIPINLKDGIELEFKRVCDRLVPYSKKKRSLMLRINRLWVSQIANRSFVEISLEFHTKENESYVSVGEFHKEISSGAGKFTVIQRNIRKAIKQSIVDFEKSSKDIDILNENNLDFSTGINEKLKIGAYRSFNMFQRNQTQKLKSDVRIKLKNAAYGVERHGIETIVNKRSIQTYAYYDGKNLYLNGYNLGGGAFQYLKSQTNGPYLAFIDRHLIDTYYDYTTGLIAVGHPYLRD